MIPGDLTDCVCNLIKLFFCVFKVLFLFVCFFPSIQNILQKKLDFGYRIRQTLNSGPIPGIPEALNQLSTLSNASLSVQQGLGWNLLLQSLSKLRQLFLSVMAKVVFLGAVLHLMLESLMSIILEILINLTFQVYTKCTKNNEPKQVCARSSASQHPG